jgi:hypothetical protein
LARQDTPSLSHPLMSPIRRPCLGPGPFHLSEPGRSRCAAHGGGVPFSVAKDSYSRMPERIRREVLARDGYRCVMPGPDEGRLEVDHIQPVSRGGQHSAANARTVCRRHHLQLTGADFGFGGRLR